MTGKGCPPPSPPAGDSYLTRPTYRPDIDGLRAIAVLSVVLFHAFPGLMPGGFIGVDIFFVISGLLIANIVLCGLDQEGGFSFWGFYARRIRRICPALVAVLGVCYAYGWLRIIPVQFSHFGKHIAAGAGFVTNFLLWRESGYFDAASSTKPLLHLWSLGIEEQFYLLLPVTLWAAHKRKRLIPGLAVALFCVSFAWNIQVAGRDAVAAFFAPWTRMWELFLGVALAAFSRSRPQWLAEAERKADALLARVLPKGRGNGSLLNDALSVAGALAIVAGLLVIDRHSAFPGWLALLPTLGTVLVLAAGKEAWLNRTVLSRPALVWLGLVSYPLYLWHWPLLVGLLPFSGGLSPMAAGALRAGVVLASVLLAALTYVWVEKPVRFGGQGGRKALGLLALLALVGGLGWATHLDRGMAFRFPERLRGVLTFTYDALPEYRYGTCLLGLEQDGTSFGNCTSGNEQGKSIVLWGDSHAAHLYRGLAAKTEKKCSLTEYTAAGCPPVIGEVVSPHPHCRQINDFVLERMAREVPQQVILSAQWRPGPAQGRNLALLAGTVEKLREIGVPEIVLVGPSPAFADAPQNLLARIVMDGGAQNLPTRMPVDRVWFDLDARMAALAQAQGITYVSPLGILCNADGCLVANPDAPGDLLFWDTNHLTRAGSVYLAAQFPE